jgi:hypothetical protein
MPTKAVPRKGHRGRFADDLTPVMERPGLVEPDHAPRDRRVRAL